VTPTDSKNKKKKNQLIMKCYTGLQNWQDLVNTFSIKRWEFLD